MLAAELGWAFYDADELHPETNIAKMRSGTPLDDSDRLPWLNAVRALVRSSIEQGKDAVVACSALKQSYRERIVGGTGAKLVYLRGNPELIQSRLEQRVGHFMSAEMLASQLAALEEPAGAAQVDVAAEPAAVVRTIREELGI